MIHRDAIASLWASRDFHLPQRDLGISMGSLVAVEPAERVPIYPWIPEALLGNALI